MDSGGQFSVRILFSSTFLGSIDHKWITELTLPSLSHDGDPNQVCGVGLEVVESVNRHVG